MENLYLLIVTGVNGRKKEGQLAVLAFTKSAVKRLLNIFYKNLVKYLLL